MTLNCLLFEILYLLLFVTVDEAVVVRIEESVTVLPSMQLSPVSPPLAIQESLKRSSEVYVEDSVYNWI